MTRPPLARLYRLYSDAVIPRLGQIVAKDGDSYAYLVESIRRFPPADQLAKRMGKAGFTQTRWRAMTGGIVAIHSGFRV